MEPHPPRGRIAATLVTLALVAGCGSEPAQSERATPREYLSAVAELLDPPGRVAALAAERLAADAGAPPAERDLVVVSVAAQRALSRLERLRLGAGDLDAQRDALANAYPAVMRRMQAVIAAVAADDRGALAPAARALFKSLRELPSDAARPRSS